MTTKPTHKTREQFARIICEECPQLCEYDSGVRFLTIAEYDAQMSDPDKGWRCPSCRCYPCEFDDDYFELPLK